MTNPTQQFLAAFNRIDAAIRMRSKMQEKADFPAVLAAFERVTYFSEGDFLLLANRLRNVIVHEKKDAFVELATPAPSVVSRMERIAAELVSPEKVEKRFVKDEVATVSPGQTIQEVLRLISEQQFSQFPVIMDGKIIGLLTENCIVRWLSSEVSKESMIEFAEATVEMVLGHEEKRANMIVVGRLRELGEIRLQFMNHALLEAAVITQSGKSDQKPLGIITRWDLIDDI